MKSMTGYASEIKSLPRFDIFMEIKSVNSRYFEFKVKSAFYLNELEIEMKNRIFQKLQRGKVDLFIKVVEKDAINYDIVVNYELAQKYENALKSLAGKLEISPNIAMSDFSNLEGIITLERIRKDEELERDVMSLLDSLLDRIVEMMEREGAKTCDDIRKSLDTLKTATEYIERIYPDSLEAYKAALKDRITELSDGGYDENRILMEVDMVASRTAVNEEIVRLKSHISQMDKILSKKVGGDSKKLDFIAQEMNREANTIASKSSDYRIIENSITIRGEIEKIREQLRNIV
jgi:uncharacterized protein (TIGR00255 family)